MFLGALPPCKGFSAFTNAHRDCAIVSGATPVCSLLHASSIAVPTAFNPRADTQLHNYSIPSQIPSMIAGGGGGQLLLPSTAPEPPCQLPRTSPTLRKIRFLSILFVLRYSQNSLRFFFSLNDLAPVEHSVVPSETTQVQDLFSFLFLLYFPPQSPLQSTTVCSISRVETYN